MSDTLLIMAFPKPNFSKTQINNAGNILVGRFKKERVDVKGIVNALDILGNWRAAHGHPLNTFQPLLRKRLQKIDPGAIVAQRLKRRPSIISKLHRFEKMQLARMQDIGGLRAVVSTLGQARALEDIYVNPPSVMFRHELVGKKDYIKSPKPDTGYRSLHLIYKYQNPQSPDYNGLYIELQIRTKLQHIWSTAVEVMGTFTEQDLKSGQGEKEILDFFSLVSSAFAHIEETPLVSSYEKLSKKETFKQVTQLEKKLGIIERLQKFNIVHSVIKDEQGFYHIVILDTEKKKILLKAFSRKNILEATKEYSKEEQRFKDNKKVEVAFVRTKSLHELRRAYPNYFADTKEFIDVLNDICEQSK